MKKSTVIPYISPQYDDIIISPKYIIIVPNQGAIMY